MGHDHAADQPGRNPPAGGVAQRLLALAVLVLDAGGRGETGAKVMAGAGLQRLAVLHHRLDRIGRDRAREPLVLGLFAGHHRHCQHLLGKYPVHFERAQRLGHRIVTVGVGGVAFLPEEFACSQEHPRTHFPAHDIGPLVGQHRQVAPALDPARHRGPDHRFAGRAHDQRLLQLGLGVRHQSALAIGDQPMVGDDRHFLGKAIDVLGLLGEV